MRIVIDTETTGLDPEQDELLQVSIICADSESVLFNKLIKPTRATSWEAATAVNHITPEMVANKLDISFYRDEIQHILTGADEIIGYNTQFDLRFLKHVAGVNPRKNSKIVDVMQEYSETYGKWVADLHAYKWVKLIEAAEHFGYDWDAAPPHDSLGDVYATLFVYNSMRDTNLYYLVTCTYADGTTAKSLAPNRGHAFRILYQLTQRRTDVESYRIQAIDPDGLPGEIVQDCPPF